MIPHGLFDSLCDGTKSLPDIAREHNLSIAALSRLMATPEFQEELTLVRHAVTEQTRLAASLELPKATQSLARLIERIELDSNQLASTHPERWLARATIPIRFHDCQRKCIAMLDRLTRPPAPARARPVRADDHRSRTAQRSAPGSNEAHDSHGSSESRNPSDSLNTRGTHDTASQSPQADRPACASPVRSTPNVQAASSDETRAIDVAAPARFDAAFSVASASTRCREATLSTWGGTGVPPVHSNHAAPIPRHHYAPFAPLSRPSSSFSMPSPTHLPTGPPLAATP